QRVRRGAKCIK
ncbi:type I restriction enzyme, partial [Helicobacter pylori]